ncbi:MAG: MFS transporter [Chloroflexi bacterium]|nr:MFS transporter [Chloroflexota bacterium]
MTASKVAAPKNMRTFLIIWLGQVISIIGSGLTGFGLAVWMFERTGEATPFALTVLAGSLPPILLSPLAGPLVDRWNRRYIMIGADVGSALITAVALLLLATSQLQVWHIYLIAALSASLSAFQEPAYTASVSLLVPEKELARANGLMQMSQALQMLAAPLLAGVFFVAIGLRGIFLIDFVTFFFAVGSLLIVRIPQPKPSQALDEEEVKPSIWREALFGFKYLRARTGLLGLLIFFAFVNFFLNFAAVLLGPLLLTFGTAAALGTVQAVGGVGMLIGSISMSAWGGPAAGRRVLAVLGFVGVAAAGLIVAGVAATAWSVGLGFFILMFTIPFGGGISQTLFQTKVAPDVQGRVFATRSMISRSMMPLAFLLAGFLADRVFEPLLREGGAWASGPIGQWVGVGPGRGIGLLFMMSGLTLVVVTIIASTHPRLRNLETELPDMLPEPEDEDTEETAVSPTQPAFTSSGS